MSGSYVGNGLGGRQITGLGFQPDVVLVKGNDFDSVAYVNTSAVMRTSTMGPGDVSKPVIQDYALVANQITALDADGFTLGSDRRVAANGITFYWAAFKANANMKVGTYTGNGTTQSITGLGFSPEFVIVMASNAARALQACSATPAGRSYEFDVGVWLANQITSLDADGFTVRHTTGAAYANASGVAYHYVAWNASPGSVAMGSYQGNAVDMRAITGIGFRPDFLFVKFIYNINSPANQSPPGMFRTDSMPYDNSYDYARTVGGNHLEDFLPDGFQIGSAMTINRTYPDCNLDGPGCEYFYVAIKNAIPPPLAATQTSTTITVTEPNSFEMTFDEAYGGSLANFFDLAEDPVRAFDLAGKPSVNFHGLFHSSMLAPTTVTTGTNSLGARLDLLEATPTRVRVRQQAFYQEVPPSTIRLAGARGIGDYSVYPEKVAVRWNRRTTAALAPAEHTLDIGVRRENAPDPRNSMTNYHQGGTVFPALATQDFVLAQREVARVRTDMLAILYADWPAADSLALATTAVYFSWRDNPAAAVPAGSDESWNLLIHYKPTNFLSNADPAVTSRRDDYRSPDILSVATGSGWFEASENTSAAGPDFFNESEAAYALTLDPASGLAFDMSGAMTTRGRPFFKIRQWRSFGDAPAVTLEGVPLTKDVDYRADVKPLARAHFAPTLSWHSTLEGAAAVTSPDVGSAGTSSGTTYVAARYGNGALVDQNADIITFPGTALSATAGAVEFWYQPSYTCQPAPGTCDGLRHVLWSNYTDGARYFTLEKTAANELYFQIRNGNGPSNSISATVAAANFGWGATDWVHLRAEWDAARALADRVRIFVNGREPPHTDSGSNATFPIAPNSYIGTEVGTANASGIIDEFHVYQGASPQALADGGLTSDANEYLADTAKDFVLGLNPVAPSRAGSYLYLGADSSFHGLNVALQAPGVWATTPGNLVWEYWNGTAGGWVDLESVGGFTDATAAFTQNGSIHWTADPGNWVPYSVNGGPDLYYVRVHLAAGLAFSWFPVESLIKTDILLFQYLGDITAAAQTFAFATAMSADLAVTKTDGAGITSAVPGTPITYTIRVTNQGPDPVASVVVTDSVQPAGGILSPSFDTMGNGTYDSGTGAWMFSSPLLVGQYADLTLSGTIDPFARGNLANTATVAPPAGFVDPDAAQNSSTDTDTLVPSVDLALAKTGAPEPVGLGSVLTYSLDLTSGPSGATGVTLTDTLPPSMLFESATPTQGTCSYSGPTRTVTCDLGPVGASAQVILRVRPQAVGTFLNTASVQGAEDPGPGGNNTASWTTHVQVFTSDVRFFTVTSRSELNVLEWVNPTADYDPAEDWTEIVYRTNGYPTGPGDGTVLYSSGAAGAGGQVKLPHPTGLGSNGVTHYYAAFVHRLTPPSVSPGRFCTGRPLDTSGPVKWSFTTGATAMTPPTVGGPGVVAPSNDRVLYAMERGPDPPGGEWPANWWPIELGDVVQSRSPVVPISVLGANPVVYLGSQDGSVYAVDATRGGQVGFPWGPAPIANMVQAAPAGIFSDFLPTLPFSYLLVGTRDESGPNAFFALDPFDGSEVGRFDNAGAGLGIVNGMAAVDYATRRVYFTSHEWGGVGTNTLWCLDLKDTAPYLELKWARALGDIDSSPVLRNGRVYVGNNGTVFSIDAEFGDNDLLDRKYVHNDGQVKGFVFPDRASDDVYFATENYVWAVTDDNPPGAMSNKFGGGISLGPGVKPSTVLFVPGSHYVYVGGSDGWLHEIDVSATPAQTALPLANGTVGAPSLDRGFTPALLHVGTEAGVFYAIETPLPPGPAMCVASCEGQFPGTPCTSFFANPCTASCACAGPLCVAGDCSDGGGS